MDGNIDPFINAYLSMNVRSTEREEVMVNIAVMGYGTVGSGVVEVLETNQESSPRGRGRDQCKICAGSEGFPGRSGAGEDHPRF